MPLIQTVQAIWNLAKNWLGKINSPPSTQTLQIRTVMALFTKLADNFTISICEKISKWNVNELAAIERKTTMRCEQKRTHKYIVCLLACVFFVVVITQLRLEHSEQSLCIKFEGIFYWHSMKIHLLSTILMSFEFSLFS